MSKRFRNEDVKKFWESETFDGTLDWLYADTSAIASWMEENGVKPLEGKFDDGYSFDVEFLYDTLSYHYAGRKFVDELNNRISILVDEIEKREHTIASAYYYHHIEDVDAEYAVIDSGIHQVSEKVMREAIEFFEGQYEGGKGIDALNDFIDEPEKSVA